ncbi:peptidylprolyl isomerase [Candidatus Viridilinea mediisalina]|uniref:peptidylprolyl isomerase n=1 Tax=Candidatus Viridilinea mediisalina TaxID=2024553 RepID=UPI001FEB857F|nr:peptidylprolyl isomerase [Candidatus Viridilinea mediisalina]
MRIVTLLLTLLLLAGCQSTQHGQALMPDPTSPVIFRLDGQAYTVADFTQRMQADIGQDLAMMLDQGQSRAEIEALANDFDIRNQIFDRMLQDLLLQRYARQHGLGVDAASLDQQVFSMTFRDPERPLEAMTDVRVQSAQEQVVLAVMVSQTHAPMSWTRQIFVADQATAEELLAELEAGADFATLARRHSLDTMSAEQGGDRGWHTEGTYVPEYDEAVASAPLNTPTLVVSRIGAHIIEVLGRDEQRPFESFEHLSTTPNAQFYFEQTFMPWYEELRRNAEASGELQLAPNFNPNDVPLPFPQGM